MPTDIMQLHITNVIYYYYKHKDYTDTVTKNTTGHCTR